jgi:MFS transporter, DHA2 family, multidrug resistance protein
LHHGSDALVETQSFQARSIAILQTSFSITEQPDGLPSPQRYQAILTIALGLAMGVIDSTVANVALPTIVRDLKTSPALAVWIINGYQLAITISLLPLASLGEIIGYRRVYLAGLVLFTFGSTCCAMSDTLALLVVARILQGLGASSILSINTALVRFIYPRDQLGRGLGINVMVVATSSAIGPTIAAGIMSIATWPYLFAVNVPLGLLTLVLGARALPYTRPARHKFDWPSAILSAVTFGFGIVAIDSVGHDTALAISAMEFAIAAVACILLVHRQAHMVSPLLPVDLLRIPVFTLSVATSVASFCSQMLALTAIPLYFANRFSYSATDIGLVITPWPIAIAVVSPISGRLVERYPAGLLCGIGLVVFGIGLSTLAMIPDHPARLDVVWRMVLAGAGFGLFQTPNNRTMIAAAPRQRSGGASGMQAIARALGMTTGATLVALCLGRDPTNGTQVALFTGTGFALLGAMLSVLRLSPIGARGTDS